MLRAKRPLIAGAMLRPFIEAYEIVADVLRDAARRHQREGPDRSWRWASAAQYVAQNRVRSNESVSALLFATARQVVADQNLLDPAADLAERRTAFLRRTARHPRATWTRSSAFSREQFFVRELVKRTHERR